MAVSTKLCLNLSPQPPPTTSNYNNSISPPSKATHVSWQRKEKSWKSQCVLGMACVVIIGLEFDSSILGSNQEISTIAGDMQINVVGKSIQKWSEKRSCPPWNGNSLETIVPENLPRLVTRRRWETVDYDTTSTRSAPEVKLVTKFSKGCFTM